MTREESTIQALRNHIEVLEDNIRALEKEPKYCDRNICISNEYNGIGCDKCEVTTSQEKIKESCDDCVSRNDVINYIRTLACDLSYWSVTDQVVRDIEALSPVTPVQKWNLTPPTKNTYDILLSVKPENEEPHVWVGSYEDGHYYFADGILDVDNEIIGWAPLPKPCEGSETE
jgi:hypothetical protein